MQEKPQFLNFIRQQEMKWTPERARIFQEASAMEGHFEVEDLVRRLRKEGSRISTATVYRTLPLLVKAGILKEVVHGEKHRHYERDHAGGRHDHLICLKCGRVVEFEEESLREIEEKICRKHEFQKERMVIEIFGYCKTCR